MSNKKQAKDFTERKDYCYGRLIAEVPKHKVRKLKNAIIIPRYSTLDSIPSYAYGLRSYLAYESDNFYYQVYNPQKFKFDYDVLIATIIQSHRYYYSEIVMSFEVVTLKKEFLG